MRLNRIAQPNKETFCIKILKKNGDKLVNIWKKLKDIKRLMNIQ